MCLIADIHVNARKKTNTNLLVHFIRFSRLMLLLYGNELWKWNRFQRIRNNLVDPFWIEFSNTMSERVLAVQRLIHASGMNAMSIMSTKKFAIYHLANEIRAHQMAQFCHLLPYHAMPVWIDPFVHVYHFHIITNILISWTRFFEIVFRCIR